MKEDYWEVTDEQVVEKTGKPLAHWMSLLTESVDLLQNQHGVPRYWARTLTTRYLKAHEKG